MIYRKSRVFVKYVFLKKKEPKQHQQILFIPMSSLSPCPPYPLPWSKASQKRVPALDCGSRKNFYAENIKEDILCQGHKNIMEIFFNNHGKFPQKNGKFTHILNL